MKFYEMSDAVKEAEYTLQNADSYVNKIAIMIIGRLRFCSPWVLEKLKKELKKYNMHTSEWKD